MLTVGLRLVEFLDSAPLPECAVTFTARVVAGWKSRFEEDVSDEPGQPGRPSNPHGSGATGFYIDFDTGNAVDLAGRLSTFAYADIGSGIRARMFAPLAGTWEDAATGSANATLAALRLSMSSDDELAYRASQGVEMGRPSELDLRAWRCDGGVRASVGGRCASMFKGVVTF